MTALLHLLPVVRFESLHILPKNRYLSLNRVIKVSETWYVVVLICAHNDATDIFSCAHWLFFFVDGEKFIQILFPS